MPLPKGLDTKLFLQELDKKADFVGCRVVYFDDVVMTTIRPGPPFSRVDLVAVVIRKGGKNIIPSNAEVQRVRSPPMTTPSAWSVRTRLNDVRP